MERESKASVLHGCFFEYKTRSLFPGATDEDIEVKVLEANGGLSKGEQADLTNYNNVKHWLVPLG